jgi:hypothetical protein
MADESYSQAKRSNPMMIAALDGEKTLQETGLTYADDGTGIDSSVTCSQDMWDARLSQA